MRKPEIASDTKGYVLMKCNYRFCVTALLCAALLTAAAAGFGEANRQIEFSGLVENLPGGQVDWGKETFYASGESAMPSATQQPNRNRAKTEASAQAKKKALANLRTLIAGTSISYEATAKDFMAQNSALRQKIEGYVENARVVRTVSYKRGNSTIVKVTVAAPMYGKNTPGSALLKGMPAVSRMSKSAKAVDVAMVKVELSEAAIYLAKAEASNTMADAKAYRAESDSLDSDEPAAPEAALYTSVIIDSLGLKVARAMSPKIRNSNGDEVWGTVDMSADEVQDHGPVAYACTMEAAMKSPRAGSNPLILKAIGRAGGNHMCDVVISDEDIATLIAANAAAQPPFLAELKVVLVVDPKG